MEALIQSANAFRRRADEVRNRLARRLDARDRLVRLARWVRR